MAVPPGDSLVTTTDLTTNIVLVVLASVAVGLRFYARTVRKSPLGPDDWTIVGALAFIWGLLILTIIACSVGGLDQTKLDVLPTIVWFLKIFFIEPFFVFPSLGLVKISIFLFYKRIFIMTWFRVCCNIAVAAIACYTIAFLIVQLNLAHPIQNAWNPTANFIEINFSDFALATVGINTCVDLITLIMPIPVIKNLRMTGKRKIIISAIFWIGLFAVVTGVIRFYYSFKEIHSDVASSGENRYSTSAKVYLWDRIEPCVAIITACLPTYGPLISEKRLLESIIRSANSVISLASGRSKRSQIASSEDPVYKDTTSLATPKAWERLHDDKGTGKTTISNEEIELHQVKAQEQPVNVHVTSSVAVEYSNQV